MEQLFPRKATTPPEGYSATDILGWPAILALVAATLGIGGALTFVAIHF
jgi:hypothetical protein